MFASTARKCQATGHLTCMWYYNWFLHPACTARKGQATVGTLQVILLRCICNITCQIATATWLSCSVSQLELHMASSYYLFWERWLFIWFLKSGNLELTHSNICDRFSDFSWLTFLVWPKETDESG
jgi:hypothetical protein